MGEVFMIILKKIKALFRKKRKVEFGSLGENVEISDSNVFSSSGNIHIGNNVYIGPEGLFIGHGGISIGSGTIISHKIEISTRNHNYNSIDLESIPYDSRYIYKPVKIGENVWIGSNVLITPGVTIGEGAVIGMGSVVTNNVPNYAVVGGNPAKTIKFRDEEKYLELRNKGQIYLEIKNKSKLKA